MNDNSELFNSNPVTLEDYIEPKVLEEEMQSSYLKYAMSVIISRALPDVRDGLKPVQRRIVYVMNKMGLTPTSKFRKTAQVVGEVMGKYHPHGDASIYSALARMGQDFSMRYMLVDPQGNFGSIDGDQPAAQRYTECRMTRAATFLTQDLEKDTVDYVDNYDGSAKEPKVLPALLPNLLINGQTGIAVGMATDIPPHNVHEVTDAIVALLDNPEMTILDIMDYIKGPDLPTGGILYGKEGILKAYSTGKGKCVLQSKTELTENEIIVTEIPYQLNKADLLIKIANLVKDKRIDGIRNIEDQSNKEGVKIVITTKRDASPEVVLNQLYNMSDLQVNLHFNMLALVNDGKQPKLLNIKEILMEFIDHRYQVVTRRTQYDLKKAQGELHILDGLKIALDFIDTVVSLIRSSANKEEAANKLIERFELTSIQADAILMMRLQTLTSMDKAKIEENRQQKIALIKELEEILNNPEVKKQLIKDEIADLVAKLPKGRNTKVIENSLDSYSKEDFIEEEEVLIQLTSSQYVKVLPTTIFRQQGRGGKGVSSFNPKDEDYVTTSLICNSHDYLYAFTNLGRLFKVRVFDLPSGSRTGRGQNLINYLEFREKEFVTNILTISKDGENDGEGYLIFATKNGIVKKTSLSEFESVRNSGKIAIGLKDDDELVAVRHSFDKGDKVILSANNGRTVIFDRSALSPLGRTAIGVKGMKLSANEDLISLEISNINFGEDNEVDEKNESDNQIDDSGELIPEQNDKLYPSLLVVTENGYGKQTHLAEYRKTARAAKGVKTLNMTKKTGKPVIVRNLYGDESNLIVTTRKGITISINPNEVNQLGRSTQGIRLIKLDKDDSVISGSVN